MWTRDPFHRLSNAFVNALKAVIPVFDSVLRLIVVGKFRRAPYGRGKFWNELKSAVSILVESTQGDSPVVDHFFANICADYGEVPHGVSQAGMCDFLMRMVVHGIGPGFCGHGHPARRAPGAHPGPYRLHGPWRPARRQAAGRGQRAPSGARRLGIAALVVGI